MTMIATKPTNLRLSPNDRIGWTDPGGQPHTGTVISPSDGQVLVRWDEGFQKPIPADAADLRLLESGESALAAPPLTDDERDRFKGLELEIERGAGQIRRGLELTGGALQEIRAQRLYRETHPSFEAYVGEKWGISRPYAYQLMDFASVHADVSAIADISWLPGNEAQARPLARLAAEERQEAARLVNAAVQDGARPTAELVQAAADQVAPRPETSKIQQEKPPETTPAPFKRHDRLEWKGDGNLLGGLMRQRRGEVTGVDPDGLVTVEGTDDLLPDVMFVRMEEMERRGFALLARVFETPQVPAVEPGASAGEETSDTAAPATGFTPRPDGTPLRSTADVAAEKADARAQTPAPTKPGFLESAEEKAAKRRGAAAPAAPAVPEEWQGKPTTAIFPAPVWERLQATKTSYLAAVGVFCDLAELATEYETTAPELLKVLRRFLAYCHGPADGNPADVLAEMEAALADGSEAEDA